MGLSGPLIKARVCHAILGRRATLALIMGGGAFSQLGLGGNLISSRQRVAKQMLLNRDVVFSIVPPCPDIGSILVVGVRSLRHPTCLRCISPCSCASPTAYRKSWQQPKKKKHAVNASNRARQRVHELERVINLWEGNVDF